MHELMHFWNSLIYEYGGPLQLVGGGLNLLAAFLCWRNNIHNWWIGLLNVLLYIVLFWQVHLYADMSLQIAFVPLQLWGWYQWLGLKRAGTFDSIFQNKEPIKFLTWNQRYLYLGLTVVGSCVMAYLFQKYTNAAVPWADSFIAMFSLFAQILLVLKYTENWYMWVPIDIASTALYWYKGLYITAIIFFWFLIQAIWASYDWYRWANQKHTILTFTSRKLSPIIKPGDSLRIYHDTKQWDKGKVLSVDGSTITVSSLERQQPNVFRRLLGGK